MKMAVSFPKGCKTLKEMEKIACYEHFFPFPSVFSKDLCCIHVWERVKKILSLVLLLEEFSVYLETYNSKTTSAWSNRTI